MPISSGANNWPRTFWSRAPKRPGVHTNVVVVDRPNAPESAVSVSRPASPKVTYRNPSPPRTPSPPPQQQPPPETTTTTTRRVVKERPPSPVRVVEKIAIPPTPSPSPPPNQTTHRYITEHHRRPRPPSPHRGRVTETNHYESNRYNRFRHHDGYDDHDSGCCANRHFTSGRDDPTGCCQGGLLGRRKYPYAGSEGFYKMPGTGRRRCCALCCGLLTGLLLLGLLAGLLGGLLPALQQQNAQDQIANTYPNGQYMNGIYYYPVTNPPDLFYLALGPGIPCNQYNNNSATAAPVPAVTAAAETGTATAATDPTATTTPTPPTQMTTTLPNCDSITTSYVQVFGISVSTTTIAWNAQFPAAAASASTPYSSRSLAVTVGVLSVTAASYSLLIR